MPSCLPPISSFDVLESANSRPPFFGATLESQPWNAAILQWYLRISRNAGGGSRVWIETRFPCIGRIEELVAEEYVWALLVFN